MTFEITDAGYFARRYFEIADLNGDGRSDIVSQDLDDPRISIFLTQPQPPERQSMTAAAPALALENVSKRFGRIQAVNQLSLEIKPGSWPVFWDPTARARAPRST
jgi:ABC-type multidrug transport system fused ATPase/permease subunit